MSAPTCPRCGVFVEAEGPCRPCLERLVGQRAEHDRRIDHYYRYIAGTLILGAAAMLLYKLISGR